MNKNYQCLNFIINTCEEQPEQPVYDGGQRYSNVFILNSFNSNYSINNSI